MLGVEGGRQMGGLSWAQRRVGAVLVIASVACAGVLPAAGCANKAQTAVEIPESQGAPSAGATASAEPFSTLGDAWTVNGWIDNNETYNVPPDFSEDGKYVVTAFPAVFDAQTGEKIWEGTPADLTFDPDDRDFKTATVSSGVGQFVLRPAVPIKTLHGSELPAGLDSDALGEKLAALALTEGESVPLAGRFDPVNVDVAPALQDVAFVTARGILAPASPGSSSRLVADEEWAAGLYDVASGEFLWTRRFAECPMPLAFLSGGRVLAKATAGGVWWCRIIGDDIDSDQDVALPETPISMLYRESTALTSQSTQDNESSWGLGVDSTGAIRQFKGPIPGLPPSFEDVDTGVEINEPYKVDYVSISPDGSQVLFTLPGSMWGVATIR